MEKKLKVTALGVLVLFFLVGFSGANAGQRIVVAEMHTNTG